MADNTALYVSIGSLVVAIGSLMVAIAGFANSRKARQEAREHTALSPRTEAIDHLRNAASYIRRDQRVSPAAVVCIRDAKSRADLVFSNQIRSEVARVLKAAEGNQTLTSFNRSPPIAQAFAEDLDRLIQRMNEDAALR